MDPLFSVEKEKRQYVAGTISIRNEDIPKLKQKVQSMHQDLILEFSDIKPQSQDQVYQINLQAFPLFKDDREDLV